MNSKFLRAETSRIVLKVNSNPKQLNATTMAKILDADASLKEHAKEDLGIDISSFDAEEKVKDDLLVVPPLSWPCSVSGDRGQCLQWNSSALSSPLPPHRWYCGSTSSGGNPAFH